MFLIISNGQDIWLLWFHNEEEYGIFDTALIYVLQWVI